MSTLRGSTLGRPLTTSSFSTTVKLLNKFLANDFRDFTPMHASFKKTIKQVLKLSSYGLTFGDRFSEVVSGFPYEHVSFDRLMQVYQDKTDPRILVCVLKSKNLNYKFEILTYLTPKQQHAGEYEIVFEELSTGQRIDRRSRLGAMSNSKKHINMIRSEPHRNISSRNAYTRHDNYGERPGSSKSLKKDSHLNGMQSLRVFRENGSVVSGYSKRYLPSSTRNSLHKPRVESVDRQYGYSTRHYDDEHHQHHHRFDHHDGHHHHPQRDFHDHHPHHYRDTDFSIYSPKQNNHSTMNHAMQHSPKNQHYSTEAKVMVGGQAYTSDDLVDNFHGLELQDHNGVDTLKKHNSRRNSNVYGGATYTNGVTNGGSAYHSEKIMMRDSDSDGDMLEHKRHYAEQSHQKSNSNAERSPQRYNQPIYHGRHSQQHSYKEHHHQQPKMQHVYGHSLEPMIYNNNNNNNNNISHSQQQHTQHRHTHQQQKVHNHHYQSYNHRNHRDM